jgi:hypothetical protein
MARLQVWTDDHLVWYERNITTAQWNKWRERIQGGLSEVTTESTAVSAAAESTFATAPAAAAAESRIAAEQAAAAPPQAATPQPPPAPETPKPAWAPPAGQRPPPWRTSPGEAPIEPDTTATRTRGRPKVWPEAPLPPNPRRLAARDTARAPAYPRLVGRWQAGLGIGYRHCRTDFGQFFPDMGQFELFFRRPVSRILSPYLSFQLGFGGMRSQIEQITATGRTALYAFEAGTLLNVPTGWHGQLYLGVGGGYYMRSLVWGGVFYTADGYIVDSPTLEVQNWGTSLRVGWQKQLRTRGNKIRILDFQARWERYGKTSMGLSSLPDSLGNAISYSASGNDEWLVVSAALVTGF